MTSKMFSFIFVTPGVSCPAVKPPTYGSMAGPTTFTFKDRLNFSCNDGYDLVGKNEIQCTADGHWDGAVPTCKSK